MTTAFDRRQLFRLGGGAVTVIALGACADEVATRGPSGSLTAPTSAAPGASATSAPTATGATTVLSNGSEGPEVFAGRRLVVVQMNGGNDLLNTLPPADSRYRQLRPTLAIPADEVIALEGVTSCGLHPSLAGLTSFWQQGRLALIQGIGFATPNRSHFVSMDRWWHADDLGAPGWLGRVLDELPSEPSPLFATALGSGAPLLNGRRVQPTVISSPGSFRWVGLEPEWIGALGDDPAAADLAGAARHAFHRTLQAVDEFSVVTGGEPTGDELPEREGGSTLAAGLAVAAQLLAADVGTQLVVVSAGGFDTHANQLPVHAELLADLADGLVAFHAAIEAAGLADQVMVVGTSEFGRRVAQNASGGCDHGAGGFAFALGAGVQGGLYGEVDLGDLLDGDVRPSLEPMALLTRCLEWLGEDAAALLGGRDDSLPLLR